MIQVTLITVGNLKEGYWRDAVSEYEKRLSAFCQPKLVQLKEARLSDNPSEGEIRAALATEGKEILAAIPPRAFCVTLCVEGKQFSSEALAKKLEDALQESSHLCFIIGSSHGLSEQVKRACDVRLSVSKLTFPHQLMRLMLTEILYRSLTITAGKRYHK